MAFKRRRFRRGRRQMQRWTAAQLNATVTAAVPQPTFTDGPQVVFTMVAKTDYDQDDAMEPKGATHTRSILHLGWGWRLGGASDPNDTYIYQWKAGIIRTSLTAAAIADLGTATRPNPADSLFLSRNDWLWTGQGGAVIPTATAITRNLGGPNAGELGINYETIDLRVKRKLDDEQIMLLISVATTGLDTDDSIALDFQLMSRSLLGGNF